MTAGLFCYEEELPNSLDALTAVYAVIGRWAEAAGLGTAARHRITVALSEAVTNAIIHARPADPDATVYVHLWIEDNRLCAEVGDRGERPWVAPLTVDLGRWEETGGRGLPLIRQLANTFAIEPRSGGGTLLRMTFLTPEGASLPGRTCTDGDHSSSKNIQELHSDTIQGDQVMDCRLESHADVDVLHIAGRLDLVSSNTLKDAVRQRLQEKRTRIVLDMNGLDFMNSSGLGALVSILKDVRLVNGRLVLAALAPYVQEIFEITQLTNVFDIYKTPAEAIQSVRVRTQSAVVTA